MVYIVKKCNKHCIKQYIVYNVNKIIYYNVVVNIVIV